MKLLMPTYCSGTVTNVLVADDDGRHDCEDISPVYRVSACKKIFVYIHTQIFDEEKPNERQATPHPTGTKQCRHHVRQGPETTPWMDANELRTDEAAREVWLVKVPA